MPACGTPGSHGYFLRAPDGSQLTLLRHDERRRIARVTHRLTMALGHLPGIVVEPKPGAIAVHYRAAAPALRKEISPLVRGVLGVISGLRVFPGRMVWEVLPAGPVDKYLAARFILRAARLRDPRPLAWPIYLGDDVSDETGVCALVRRIGGGGKAASNTAARYFVQVAAGSGRVSGTP